MDKEAHQRGGNEPPDEQVPDAGPAGLSGRPRLFYEILFIAVLVMAGLGMALTNASPGFGYRYWAVTVVLFGLAAMGAAAVRASAEGGELVRPLAVQGAHWLLALFAVFVLHMLMQAGRMTFPAAGFSTMLMVGFSLSLDGLYQTGWRFALLGLAIMAMVLVIAWFAVYVWLIVIGALVLWGIAIAIERKKGHGPVLRA